MKVTECNQVVPDLHYRVTSVHFSSSHHLHVSFLSWVKMNSTNWPPPNVWVFIAQMVEYCSTNAEAMSSNPVEVSKFFFSGLFAIA